MDFPLIPPLCMNWTKCGSGGAGSFLASSLLTNLHHKCMWSVRYLYSPRLFW